LLPLKTLRRLFGSRAYFYFAAPCQIAVMHPYEKRPHRIRGLHGEDYAKLGFAAHHVGVGVVDSVEGEFFDHCADAG